MKSEDFRLGQDLLNSEAPSAHTSWLNRTTLGIGLTSLFSDWSHEIATAILPAFLASLGAGPGWLGVIEGTADGLSSFSKLAAGHYTDRLRHRKVLVQRGMLSQRLRQARWRWRQARGTF